MKGNTYLNVSGLQGYKIWQHVLQLQMPKRVVSCSYLQDGILNFSFQVLSQQLKYILNLECYTADLLC
jgi:hypothetical protein